MPLDPNIVVPYNPENEPPDEIFQKLYEIVGNKTDPDDPQTRVDWEALLSSIASLFNQWKVPRFFGEDGEVMIGTGGEGGLQRSGLTINVENIPVTGPPIPGGSPGSIWGWNIEPGRIGVRFQFRGHRYMFEVDSQDGRVARLKFGDQASINFYDNSFVMITDTARLNLHQNSRIFMAGGRPEIIMMNSANLNMFNNTEVTLANNAKLTMDLDSHFRMTDNTDITFLNNARLTMQNDSRIDMINTARQVMVNDSRFIMRGTHAGISNSETTSGEDVRVSGSPRIRMLNNADFHMRDTSRIWMRNAANALMENNASFNMHNDSRVEMRNTSNIFMLNDSSIQMTHNSLLMMDRNSEINFLRNSLQWFDNDSIFIMQGVNSATTTTWGTIDPRNHRRNGSPMLRLHDNAISVMTNNTEFFMHQNSRSMMIDDTEKHMTGIARITMMGDTRGEGMPWVHDDLFPWRPPVGGGPVTDRGRLVGPNPNVITGEGQLITEVFGPTTTMIGNPNFAMLGSPSFNMYGGPRFNMVGDTPPGPGNIGDPSRGLLFNMTNRARLNMNWDSELTMGETAWASWTNDGRSHIGDFAALDLIQSAHLHAQGDSQWAMINSTLSHMSDEGRFIIRGIETETWRTMRAIERWRERKRDDSPQLALYDNTRSFMSENSHFIMQGVNWNMKTGTRNSIVDMVAATTSGFTASASEHSGDAWRAFSTDQRSWSCVSSMSPTSPAWIQIQHASHIPLHGFVIKFGGRVPRRFRLMGRTGTGAWTNMLSTAHRDGLIYPNASVEQSYSPVHFTPSTSFNQYRIEILETYRPVVPNEPLIIHHIELRRNVAMTGQTPPPWDVYVEWPQHADSPVFQMSERSHNLMRNNSQSVMRNDANFSMIDRSRFDMRLDSRVFMTNHAYINMQNNSAVDMQNDSRINMRNNALINMINDSRLHMTHRGVIEVFNNAWMTLQNDARLLMTDNSQMHMSETSRIRMENAAWIHMTQNANQRMRDNARILMSENADLHMTENSRLRMQDDSWIHTSERANIRMRHTANIYMRDDATLNMTDNSIIESSENAHQTMTDNSRSIMRNQAHFEMIQSARLFMNAQSILQVTDNGRIQVEDNAWLHMSNSSSIRTEGSSNIHMSEASRWRMENFSWGHMSEDASIRMSDWARIRMHDMGWIEMHNNARINMINNSNIDMQHDTRITMLHTSYIFMMQNSRIRFEDSIGLRAHLINTIHRNAILDIEDRRIGGSTLPAGIVGQLRMLRYSVADRPHGEDLTWEGSNWPGTNLTSYRVPSFRLIGGSRIWAHSRSSMNMQTEFTGSPAGPLISIQYRDHRGIADGAHPQTIDNVGELFMIRNDTWHRLRLGTGDLRFTQPANQVHGRDNMLELNTASDLGVGSNMEFYLTNNTSGRNLAQWIVGPMSSGSAQTPNQNQINWRNRLWQRSRWNPEGTGDLFEDSNLLLGGNSSFEIRNTHGNFQRNHIHLRPTQRLLELGHADTVDRLHEIMIGTAYRPGAGGHFTKAACIRVRGSNDENWSNVINIGMENVIHGANLPPGSRSLSLAIGSQIQGVDQHPDMLNDHLSYVGGGQGGSAFVAIGRNIMGRRLDTGQRIRCIDTTALGVDIISGFGSIAIGREITSENNNIMIGHHIQHNSQGSIVIGNAGHVPEPDRVIQGENESIILTTSGRQFSFTQNRLTAARHNDLSATTPFLIGGQIIFGHRSLEIYNQNALCMNVVNTIPGTTGVSIEIGRGTFVNQSATPENCCIAIGDNIRSYNPADLTSTARYAFLMGSDIRSRDESVLSNTIVIGRNIRTSPNSINILLENGSPWNINTISSNIAIGTPNNIINIWGSTSSTPWVSSDWGVTVGTYHTGPSHGNVSNGLACLTNSGWGGVSWGNMDVAAGCCRIHMNASGSINIISNTVRNNVGESSGIWVGGAGVGVPVSFLVRNIGGNSLISIGSAIQIGDVQHNVTVGVYNLNEMNADLIDARTRLAALETWRSGTADPDRLLNNAHRNITGSGTIHGIGADHTHNVTGTTGPGGDPSHSHGSGSLGAASSDIRDKIIEGKVENVSSFLNQIDIVRYRDNKRTRYINMMNLSESECKDLKKYGITNYDKELHAQGTKASKRIRSGIVAQQVQGIIQSLYGSDNIFDLVNDNLYEKDHPDHIDNQLTVNYEKFTPLLIKGFQEQSKELQDVKAELEALKALVYGKLGGLV